VSRPQRARDLPRGSRYDPGALERSPENDDGSAGGGRGRALARIAPLALALAAACAYSNGFDGPFVFDDHGDIADNLAIRSLDSPLDVVLEQGQSGVSGRPLVALSYALNYAADPPEPGRPLDPRSWHLVNVAIHLATALLLYGSVRRALSIGTLASRWGRSATGLALAASLIWVAHPLSTGVIMYRGQRVESLMATFFVATLYCALRAFASERPRPWARLAVLACALGTACKEVIVGAPLVVLAFDALFVAGSWRAAWGARKRMYAGLFATWLLIGAWVWLAEGRSDSVGFGYSNVGVGTYLTTQAWALPRYLKLVVWPDPLIFDYGVRPVTELARWLPGAVAVLAALAATAWGLARREPWSFVGAWWFVILAPSSSFLPIVTELVVEHRAYLPSAAVIVALVLAAHAALERAIGARARVAGAALALAACAAGALLTRDRNRDYATELGLWEDTVAKMPDNARARASYGNDLRVAGRIEEAGVQYAEAVRLSPDDPYWRANHGTWLISRDRLDEGIAELERSRELLPTYGMTLQNLWDAYRIKGDVERSIEAGMAALEHGPPAPAVVARGVAQALAARGRETEALEAYARAVRWQPRDPELALTLARMLLRAKAAADRDPAEALRLAQRAFTLRSSTDPEALEVAADAQAALGRSQDARADAAEARARSIPSR
jgi:tetratricopeptide (TPR) repeat protein